MSQKIKLTWGAFFALPEGAQVAYVGVSGSEVRATVTEHTWTTIGTSVGGAPPWNWTSVDFDNCKGVYLLTDYKLALPPETLPEPKPRCKHSNTAAPELNIVYPTKSGSLSPFAIESYELACLKAENEGLKRAKRILREYPVCKYQGSPLLQFSPEGAAYWECECSGVAE
jgi:hypothetical protein